MVKCCICGLSFKKITNTHLNKRHGITSLEFAKRYPNADRGLLPWNKGKTKHTHHSIRKLAERLMNQKKWNFSPWQKARKIRMQREKRQLNRTNDLAEFIGIFLGDGNLSKLPRTEALRIVCNSEQKDYINHVVELTQSIFNKKPATRKRNGQKTTDIVLYKLGLSKRLGFSCGNKIKNKVRIPKWIKNNRTYSINCLKGLFETDGCFCEDEGNYTHIIELKNKCKNLLHDTYQILNTFGYHPQLGKNYVRLARKNEAFSFKDLIAFRDY